MANSKSKSPRAKTKTTKKPVTAKSAAKTTNQTKTTKPVKATPKTAAKKVEKTEKKVAEPKVTTKPAAVKKRGLFTKLTNGVKEAGLRKMHGVSAFIFVALAAVAGAYMKPVGYQLSLGYLTKDELLDAFVPAQHAMLSIDLRWVVVGVLTASALFSIARMTRLSVAEDKGLKVRIQPWRWVDLALTGAAMMEVAALLYGMQELAALKLVGGLTVFALVLAWIAERENSGSEKFVKGAFLASIVASAVVISTIASYGWATVVYGMVRYPWYAYALFGTLVLASILLIVNQYLGFKGKKAWANYLFVERNYLLINLVTKVAFGVILIVGLLNI